MTKRIFILLILISFNCLHLRAQEKEQVIDQIIAIVGGNIIKLSDVEHQYIQYLSEGYTKTENIKCSMLDQLLYHKLLLNQAQLDSVKITEEQVDNELERRMRFFVERLGSEQKMEEFYQKSIPELKDEFRPDVKEQLLIQQMESKITEDLKVTPSDIKLFFRSLPEDSIPLVNSEMEIGQIVKQPEVGIEEKKAVRDKLNALRERVLKGESFATLAILYSEDPESAKKGGELGLKPRGTFVPEFETAAFELKKNEVSPVIETKFGYHILQLIERQGEYINVKHILIQPKVSTADLVKAKNYLDSVKTLIDKKKITFEEAATLFSDDPGKNNGGLIVNPQSGNTRFETDQLDPSIFFVIDKLKLKETSKPVIMKSAEGKQAYRLLYLKTRSEPHRATIKDDYDRIQAAALADKKNKTLTTWINDKIKKTYIHINDEWKVCQFKRNWLKE